MRWFACEASTRVASRTSGRLDAFVWQIRSPSALAQSDAPDVVDHGNTQVPVYS